VLNAHLDPPVSLRQRAVSVASTTGSSGMHRDIERSEEPLACSGRQTARWHRGVTIRGRRVRWCVICWQACPMIVAWLRLWARRTTRPVRMRRGGAPSRATQAFAHYAPGPDGC
jgi:hypothetical protein